MGLCGSRSLPTSPDEASCDKREGQTKIQHVLIVDDVPINCEIIEDYIVLFGYTPQITQVYNGPDAIQKIQEHPEINLALIDIKMEPMDGYELANRLRTQEDYHALIIGITGMVDKPSVRKALHHGMDDVCAKPLNFENFLKLLSEKGYYLPDH